MGSIRPPIQVLEIPAPRPGGEPNLDPGPCAHQRIYEAVEFYRVAVDNAIDRLGRDIPDPAAARRRLEGIVTLVSTMEARAAALVDTIYPDPDVDTGWIVDPIWSATITDTDDEW